MVKEQKMQDERGKSTPVIKNNIIFTGMPGSGKSTVGVILARELCMGFIDTDVLIQSGKNMTLQEIVDTQGLQELLAIEERTVSSLTVTNTVIAPGGSVVLSETAMKSLKKSGIIVFLDVPLELIIHRIDMYIRGIIKQPGDTLEDVWREREPLYRHYADILVECNSMNQTEIANYIINRVVV